MHVVWITYILSRFRMLNFVFFQAVFLSKRIDSRYLVCATPPTIYAYSFESFMVCRSSCDLNIILRLFLCQFFPLMDLSDFQA